MAEPRTEWGQQAVEDIRELKAGQDGLKKDVAGLRNDVSGLRGEVSSLRSEFDKFQGTVKGVGYTLCVLVTVFGALTATGIAWMGVKVVEHETELRHLDERTRIEGKAEPRSP